MSGDRRDRRPPRQEAAPSGGDPWARWRQPADAASAGVPEASPEATSSPEPAGSGERTGAAGEARETDAAAPRSLGTLGVRRGSQRADPRQPAGGFAKSGKAGRKPASAAQAPQRKEGGRPAGKPASRPERASGNRPAAPVAGDNPWRQAARGAAGKNAAFTASTVNAAPSVTTDAAASATPADPRPAPTGIRLSKLMSERGLCSRREADLWIERGWVFVDGCQISELGSRIDPQAEITVSQEAKKDQAKSVTILLHKPVGYVSGQPEPGCVPAVTLITLENQQPHSGGPEFKPWMLRGLAPAGRLDVDSTGLLVLTSDGRVAKKLIGDDSQAEKEYLVRVSGQMIAGGLDLLRHGLELDGKALRPAWIKQLNEDQLHFILKEGRKRQIRRMCELVGLKVVGLKRVRIGRIRLGDLPPGQWRFLREGEAF